MDPLFTLGNLNVDSRQRKLFLSAASPPANPGFSRLSSLDYFVKDVKYDTTVSVICQCDRPPKMTNMPVNATSAAVSSSKIAPGMRGNGNNDRSNANARQNRENKRSRITRDEVINAKRTQKCMRCGKYDHWYGDHSQYGSIPATREASDKPIESDFVAHALRTSSKKPSPPNTAANMIRTGIIRMLFQLEQFE